MKLISAKDLLAVEMHLSRRLDGYLTSESADIEPLNRVLEGFVLRGGKRLRPQLCLWTYAAAGGFGADPSAVLDVACAWEVFHAFLLVHDDLIDAADVRRSTPSLHRQLQSLDHNSPIFGRNLAIVAGDLLYSVAMRLMVDAAAEPAVLVQLMKLFARVACTTGYGQAIDLFQSQLPPSEVAEATLLCGYDWKTAAYTFEGPMLSGAMLAGANTVTTGRLSTFAKSLGQAYQLQNDLADLTEPAHDGCDLVQGKRTVTLMRTRSSMSLPQRNELDRRLSELTVAEGDAVFLAERLRHQLIDGGAIDRTEVLIDRLLNDAATAAADIGGSLGRSLCDLLDRLRSNYFAVAVA